VAIRQFVTASFEDRMYITYLILGSNLGDRHKYLSDAADLINERLGNILVRSSVYQTASWGLHDQPDFINQVIMLDTQLSPEELLKEILAIELELGRERERKWGSRVIDIDILFYDDWIVNRPELKIPHPLLHERGFCLQPLNELAPEFMHPVLKKSVSCLLMDLSDTLFVKKLS
jgi:2-amino-4-hydroxy-6-hydroxymethyldihydropteridine diphosphokinase